MNRFILVIIVINLINYISCLNCNGVIPITQSSCNSLNNNIYTCCFLNSTIFFMQKLCYGVVGGTDLVYDLTSITIQGNLFKFYCGVPDPGLINIYAKCGTNFPTSPTDCYLSGGSGCCMYTYQFVKVCINSTSTDPTAQPLLNSLVCFGKRLEFSYFLLIIYVFFI